MLPAVKPPEGESHARKPRFLPTGTLLRTTIVNAIFSFNLATPVVAKLDEDAAFQETLVLPRNTKLIGKALVLKSHDRVNVLFNLAVLPDGTEMEIGGVALSPDGSAGIVGRVQKFHDSGVASAALKGAVLGATTLAAGANANPVLSQTSQAVADETTAEVDIAREEVDTSISVPEFTRCLVYLERRLEIKPKEEPNALADHKGAGETLYGGDAAAGNSGGGKTPRRRTVGGRGAGTGDAPAAVADPD